MAMGSDFHTFHVHGHRWRDAGRRAARHADRRPGRELPLPLARGGPGHVALPLPRRGPHDARHDRHLPRRAPMRRAALASRLAAAPLLAAGAAPPRRGAAPAGVNVQFAGLRARRSSTCCRARRSQWTNVSERTHTVTSDDGSFDSGELVPGGVVLAALRRSPGAFPYHCTIHAGHGRRGRRAPRDPRRRCRPPPSRPAQRVEVTGRTADPALPVTIERDGRRRAPDRRPRRPRGRRDLERVAVTATAPADYRAVAGGRRQPDPAAARQRPAGRPAPDAAAACAATVTPRAPVRPGRARGAAARALRLVADRAPGGWTTSRAPASACAAARRVRVVLVDRDGWTPLATSRALRLRS